MEEMGRTGMVRAGGRGGGMVDEQGVVQMSASVASTPDGLAAPKAVLGLVRWSVCRVASYRSGGGGESGAVRVGG